MENLKIKKFERITRNKTIRAKRTKIEDAEAVNYSNYKEALTVQFPIRTAFNFFSKCDLKNFKRR